MAGYKKCLYDILYCMAVLRTGREVGGYYEFNGRYVFNGSRLSFDRCIIYTTDL